MFSISYLFIISFSIILKLRPNKSYLYSIKIQFDFIIHMNRIFDIIFIWNNNKVAKLLHLHHNNRIVFNCRQNWLNIIILLSANLSRKWCNGEMNVNMKWFLSSVLLLSATDFIRMCRVWFFGSLYIAYI